ncbi:hypothetical protein F5Y04DRAFT_285003 [Hypomontagnella monticulosa]|nr:hypothetical protein F5Y04DRAFT_285003 [Hypomontagnella monticulosa]
MPSQSNLGTAVRAMEKFLAFGPLWLVLFLLLATYANDYLLAWLTLMAPQDTGVGFVDNNPATWYIGICMILVSATLKANWFLAWLDVFITCRIRDRKWTPPGDPSTKRIMQADHSMWASASLGGRCAYEPGRRPRRCPSGCTFDLTDRVYHCTRMDRCLPLYDHYCAYIQSSVYLRTVKPYCFILVFLPLDVVYSFAVSLTAICHPSTRWTAPFVASIISASILVLLVALANTFDGLRRLVWDNSLTPERGEALRTIAFKYQDDSGFYLRLYEFFNCNPWHLGPRENFRQVFGQHWWMWPFFWWQPERVSRYGTYEDCDLPYAEVVRLKYTNSAAPRMTGVAIDPPAPSAARGGPSRNRQPTSSTSDIELGSILNPRGIRQRTQGHSSSHDQDL